jgi:hypothetical protein
LNSTLLAILGLLIFARVGAADSLDTWTWRSPSDVPVSLGAVAFGKGQFLAVSQGGDVLSSTNGLSWSELPPAWTNGVDGSDVWVVFGNGHFVPEGVVFDPAGNSIATVAATTDGNAWNSRQLSSWFPICLMFDGSRFVALLGRVDSTSSEEQVRIDTSADGIDWQTSISPLPAWIGLAAFGNGLFVGVQDSGFLVSEDGLKWGQRSSGTTNSIGSITFGNGKFVAVSSLQSEWNPTTRLYNYIFLTSIDATNWTQTSWASKRFYQHLSYANGQFMGLGIGNDGGSVAFSTDGRTWVEQPLGYDVSLHDITFGNGRWVGVGELGLTVASQDGVNWSRRESVTSASFNAVTYANGWFVAVGDQIVTSTNGVNWIQHQSPTTNSLRVITFGNGTFVAASSLAETVTSTDAVNWERHAFYIYGDIIDMAFGNGRFVGLGYDTIISSADGISWREELSIFDR